MHTTKIDDLVFHHDEDFSGDVVICDVATGERLACLPFEALKRFVASYVRHRKVRLLEDANADEVLLK